MIDGLVREIERRYGWHASGTPTRLTGGDECAVWAISTDQGTRVIRVSPEWRSRAEIQWTHDLMAHCAASVPEVVCPIVGLDGASLFTYGDQPVGVYPYVDGGMLDRGSAEMRLQAARLLSRIHRAAATWPYVRKRPDPDNHDPYATIPNRSRPRYLHDIQLNGWFVMVMTSHEVSRGPIHGDYYRRNVLCENGRISGVIDWDEAEVMPIMAETAWSAWEFCKTESGDDLAIDQARDYLAAYFEGNPPCHRSETQGTISFIRWRLRREIESALARLEQGGEVDQAYMDQEKRAFKRLKGRERELVIK